MATQKITSTTTFEGKSIQSTFTKEKIDEKLKDYKKITPDKWCEIKTGDFIRYFSNGSFKSGGHVKINNYPDYIVVANYFKNISWCIQLKSDPTLVIYIKTLQKINSEKEKMKKIYQMYKDGKLQKK